MLNKELLLGNNSNIPHTHVLHVTERTTSTGTICYGLRRGGSTIPEGVMINGVSVHIRLINTCYGAFDTLTSANFQLSNYSPVADLYLGRADDKRVSLVKAVLDGSTVNYDIYKHDVLLFSKDDLGKDIPLWISTTPPPKRAHHHIDTRAYRVEYCVEGKVPWEAQNAEQGASYGCR